MKVLPVILFAFVLFGIPRVQVAAQVYPPTPTSSTSCQCLGNGNCAGTGCSTGRVLECEDQCRLGTEMFRWNVTVIGAAGISAFPMAGRIAAKMAHEEDPDNFILMHAMGANTAGQLGSVIAGGILLSVVSKMMGL